ncbi:hypothetical protein PITC_052780 [Penicillium italicum]|uniref:Uncharacterized protein n=1 Tax=Penicillium italicum TaxID=40296 RepID=A0A0A2KCR7_PENIT|nr:hypothetical protein PITC_052780 [Penicillium italicum]
MPKLSSENPNELLWKEGVADELLATREEERGRKRELEDMTDRNAQSPKRARSLSRVLPGQSTQDQSTAHPPGSESTTETPGDGDENLALKNEVVTVEQEDIASEETAEARVWIRIE